MTRPGPAVAACPPGPASAATLRLQVLAGQAKGEARGSWSTWHWHQLRLECCGEAGTHYSPTVTWCGLQQYHPSAWSLGSISTWNYIVTSSDIWTAEATWKLLFIISMRTTMNSDSIQSFAVLLVFTLPGKQVSTSLKLWWREPELLPLKKTENQNLHFHYFQLCIFIIFSYY